VSGRPFETTFVGDDSLMNRPMRRLVDPLGKLGAQVSVSPDGTPPVTVVGGRLRGADIELPVPSAQVRTAVALAALQAEGATSIDSAPGFRDHTERRLEAMGLARRHGESRLVVSPGPVPAEDYRVAGDPSAASVLLASAALRPGARVTTRGISLNPGRSGFLDVLAAMGADVFIDQTDTEGGEPIGDVSVIGKPLVGTEVNGELSVRALDELPLVAVLAGAADGETTVADAGELRHKESDRVASTVAMIRALGGDAHETGDGFVVRGTGGYAGGLVSAAGDHRIVLASAVATTACTRTVTIDGWESVRVSWPSFFESLEAVWSSQ
jgi:3-phosphoshikimate 1-carboxyvinyltransferase